MRKFNNGPSENIKCPKPFIPMVRRIIWLLDEHPEVEGVLDHVLSLKDIFTKDLLKSLVKPTKKK